jgi:hypothetical protein
MEKLLLPNGKPHISFSEMKDWMQCPHRHNLKHIKKIDLSTKGIQLLFGTAVHASLEHFLNTREVSATPALEEWKKGIENDFKDAPEALKFDEASFIKNIEEIVLETQELMAKEFPEWTTVEAEEELYEPLVDVEYPDYNFKGFIDCVIKYKKSEKVEKYAILDWKTASRPWGKDKLMDPKHTYQIVAYKHFWSKKHDVPLKDITCGFVTITKTAKFGKRLKFINQSVGEVPIKKCLTVIGNFVHNITEGRKIKKPSDDNCRFCEYKNTEHCKID